MRAEYDMVKPVLDALEKELAEELAEKSKVHEVTVAVLDLDEASRLKLQALLDDPAHNRGMRVILVDAAGLVTREERAKLFHRDGYDPSDLVRPLATQLIEPAIDDEPPRRTSKYIRSREWWNER